MFHVLGNKGAQPTSLLIQYWPNVGPATQMVVQQWANVGSTILDEHLVFSRCYALYILYNRRDAPRDDQLFTQQSGATANCSSCYLSNLLYAWDNVNVQCVGLIYVYMYTYLILLRFDKVELTFLTTIWINKTKWISIAVAVISSFL